jgi:Ca2+-binding RTX toxin-like protein
MRGSLHHIAQTVMVGVVAAVLALPAYASAWRAPRSGGLGHQTLRGGPGPDFLRGAEGPDTVRGNGGADLLTGDTGPDTVYGGSGSDTIVGGAGNDGLSGGPGNDVISGGFGADVLDGGPGDDALDGGSDSDTLSGGDGNDVLHGGSGIDRLDGGAGDDRIFADSGGDTIDGGPGDDVVVVDGSAFAHVDCGPGRDTLYITAVADAIADYAGRGIVTKYTGCETVELTDVLNDPDKGITYLAPDAGGARTATKQDDTLLGGPGPDVLHGGDGDDVLWGLRQPDVQSYAADVLDGGPGDDTIYGGPGRQRISGGAGDDYLESGIGDGTIDGGSGDDTIRLRGGGLTKVDAGAGNDTIYARGAARAIIHCGPGRDVANADRGDEVARDCERVVGGARRPKRAKTRATYADAVQATPGLVHWWRLDEPEPMAAVQQIHDQIGGLVGGYYGDLGVPGVTDDGDTAFETPTPSRLYDGEGSLSLQIDDTLLHHAFTFEAWFRPDDAGTARAMLTDTATGSASGVVLVREADGSLHAIISSSADSARAEVRTAPLSLVPGSWHHVALTRADDRIAIYVDGNLAADAPATPIAFSDLRAGVGVGERFGTYEGWVGGIDEVAFYDRALDAATIHAHAYASDDGAAPVARADPAIAPVLGRAGVIGLTADRAGASFRCSLDGSAYLPCRSPVPVAGIHDGAHELRVLATSRVGVAQQTPTVLHFRTDDTLPSTVLVVRVSPDSDDRAIASFGSDGPGTFECRYPVFYSGPDDRWQPCSPPMDVVPGMLFQVRAVDAVGNRDDSPASVVVPQDGQGFSTGQALATFAGARAEAQIAGESIATPNARGYQCRVDGRGWAACPTTLRLPILDAGGHSLQVRQSILGASATTAPLTWSVGARPGGAQIAGMQAPLVVERGAGLLRRAPAVRFALSAPAAVQIAVLARGAKPRIAVSAAGRTGSNVVALPGRALRALGTGRFTLRLTARAAAGAPAVQQLPLAIVPSLR